MWIDDMTEFPDISASMSLLSTKPPFSNKTALNPQQKDNNRSTSTLSGSLDNGDNEETDIGTGSGQEEGLGRSRSLVSVSSSIGRNDAVVFCQGKVESTIPNQDVGVEFGFNVMENTTYFAQEWSSESVPVVFCRGDVESIIPNQDVGVEFGFNVMENTTYLAQASPPQSVTESIHSDGCFEPLPRATPPNPQQREDDDIEMDDDDRTGQLQDDASCSTRTSPSPSQQQQNQQYSKSVIEGNHSDAYSESLPRATPPNAQQRDDYIQTDDDDRTDQLQDDESCPTPPPFQQLQDDESCPTPPPFQKQQNQHPSQQSLSCENQMPCYSHPSQPTGPPQSLFSNYPGPSDSSDVRQQYPPRSYRGRNGGGDRELQQTQQQQTGLSGAPLQVLQQAIMSQSQQFAMPIPLPSPTGCGPPINQVHYAIPQQIPQPLPHHMLPHYVMVAAPQVEHRQNRGRVQQGYHSQQQPRVSLPPPHRYMQPPSKIGAGLRVMPISNMMPFQPRQQIPASSAGGIDEGGMMEAQLKHMQPHQMQISLSTGATNCVTLPPVLPMMPNQRGLQVPSNHPPDGHWGPSVSYIGTVEHGDGDIMTPNGFLKPCLRCPPPNYVVPMTPIEVESWMNGYLHHKLESEAEAERKIAEHRND